MVTLPLGVLKRGLPRFTPALPPDRLAAIGRLGFGRFEKVALRFAEPIWREAGKPQAHDVQKLFRATQDHEAIVRGPDRTSAKGG